MQKFFYYFIFLPIISYSQSFVINLDLATGNDILYSVIEVDENNYITCGGGYDLSIETPFGLCIKFNNKGDTIWTKKFYKEGDNYITIYDISPILVDNTYLIAGHISSALRKEAYLGKIDFNGNIIWEKTYSIPGTEAPGIMEILPVNDTAIALLGVTDTAWLWPKQKDIWVQMVDQKGDSIWANTYSVNKGIRYPAIIQKESGEFLISTYSNILLTVSDNGLLLKKDTLIFSKLITQNSTYTTTGYITNPIEKDSSFYLGASVRGSMVDPSIPNERFSIMKTDTNIDTLWWYRYPQTDELVERKDVAVKIVQNNEGNYVVGGTWDYQTNFNLSQTGNAYLIKTDTSGNFIWDAMYWDDDRYQEINDMIYTSDGGYLLVGWEAPRFNSNIKTDIFIVKFDSLGNVDTTTSIASIVNNKKGAKVYPNPFDNNITVSYPDKEPAEFYLYDITGKEITQKTIQSGATINLSGQAEGFYIYQVITSSGVLYSGKVVKN